jgi:hypothetical protein
MKTTVLALALIANSLLVCIETSGFQTPPTSSTPRIHVDATYDKKKDVTKIFLQPLLLWSNRQPDSFDQVRLFVGFEVPGTKIVKPKAVLFHFSASSSNVISFQSFEFSVLIDGTLLELGKLKGSQRRQINSPRSMTVYDDESITISYDDFTRIATSDSVTIIVGKRKFDLSGGQVRSLREFHALMQREGQELNKPAE